MTDKRIRPEFSRPLPVEDIGEGVERTISARPKELEALAKRMNLPAIRALSATLRIAPEGGGAYMVRGALTAEVEQECVRTLEIFPATVRAEVERLFVPADSPEARALEAGAVMELDADAPDEPDIIRDAEIDLGELAAEVLALSLEPWPRKPGTDFVEVEAGTPETPQAGEARGGRDDNPFAVLHGLKPDDE